jgi:hypothetical protein
MQQSASSASKRSQPFRWGTLERLDSARREFSRRRKSEARRAPAKTAWCSSQTGQRHRRCRNRREAEAQRAPTETPRIPQTRHSRTRRLRRPLAWRCVSQGRQVRQPTRVSERLVAAKSITLAAVPDRYCGGAGLRGRTCWSRRDGRVRPARDPAFAASVESRLTQCERRSGRWCLRGRAVYFVL